MYYLNSFEADLLRILHGFFGRAALAQIQPLVLAAQPRPPGLSPSCIELVKDTLAKGCIRWLAAIGGWRQERFLRDGQPVSGRLWERTPPNQLGLTFSANTLDFLMWVTATRLGVSKPPTWRRLQGIELTLGDQLLMYLAYETLRPISEVRPWLNRFVGHSLCRLAFPQDFTRAAPLAADQWACWTQGQGACVLEAMQHRLTECWVEAERSKGKIARHHEMLALGHSQEQTLDGFLGAANAAGRRDLARFLLAAARRLLNNDPSPKAWIATVDVSGLRMADRADVYRAAAAFLRSMETLEAWQREARGVGFLDEDYAASQLWKAEWERFDADRLCLRAKSIVQTIAPLPG